ncbi:MAG: GNAT family N-acetyltransferase [Gemmataceae bacterium]
MNVSAATAGELDAALRLLVGHRPPADRGSAIQRYRDLIASGDLDPAGIFVARGATRKPVGAMLVSVMPGALGLAWPPVANRRKRIETEDALVAAACSWLRSRGVKVCQAFGDGMDALERAGFRNLTSLLELRRELHDTPPPIRRLAFEPLSVANRDAFFAMLLATFDGSLDCPEVNGTRTATELLATYIDMPPVSWHLVRRGDEPVGVVLLNAAAGSPVCELTYLGLAPKFRRAGYGSELVSFARITARNSGRLTLVLSVDERNRPARRLYETHGFQASGARSVFLADWPAIS